MRIFIIFALLFCGHILAAERVVEYVSDVKVNSDASLRVHESIRVFAQNDQIRHGIRSTSLVHR